MEHYFESSLQEIATTFVDSTVVKIEPNESADEGFTFTFDNGSILEVGWSGQEGGYSIRNILHPSSGPSGTIGNQP